MKSGSQRRKSHFCTVCQRTVKMDMLRKGPDDEVTWLQCPDCDGYVPLLSATVKEMMGQVDFPGTVIPADVPQYDMSSNYNIGQVFYHPVWDDFGIVLQKGKKSKEGRAIMVSFIRGGLKKIVEDFGPTSMPIS